MCCQLSSKLLAGAVAASLLFGAAACSGGGAAEGPSTFDPARAAELLRALGVVKIDGTGEAGDKESPVQGTIDYERDLAQVTFPFADGPNRADVEYRRIGGDAWLRRGSAQGTIGFGPQLLVLAPPGEKRPWVKTAPETPNTLVVMGAYEPAVLLANIAKEKAQFSRADDAKVGGSSRRGFTATIPGRAGTYIGSHRVTVWVDRDGLPLRFDLDAALGPVHVVYDVERGEPFDVAPPPADETYRSTPLPEASGPYREVAAGTAGTTPYRVLSAPASDGGTCWKVESTPAYKPLPTPRRDGGVCVAKVDPNARDYNDRIAFPIDATAETPYEMFAMLVPAGSTAEMHLVGGGRAPVPVDAATGLVLYAGPAEPVAALLEVRMAGGGPRLYCAPGEILVPGDIADVDDGSALRSAAWNCVDAADIEG